MLQLTAALVICAVTWKVLQGGWRGARGFQLAGFDPSALGMGVVAIGAAMYFWGVLYGIALIIAVIIHEFGHVAAFRVCGHADARFRLIPLLGGVAISDSQPSRADKAFFITLMGPSINLGPMVLCFALSELALVGDAEWAYQVGVYLYIQGLVLASLNFFNLLPLWPLDGGRLTQRLVYTFAPDLTRPASIAMAALAVLMCLATQSWFLLAFVAISWPGLMQSEKLLAAQRPLSRARALLALAAYIATTATFFVGGQELFLGMF
jgi:Zn-dependent protease